MARKVKVGRPPKPKPEQTQHTSEFSAIKTAEPTHEYAARSVRLGIGAFNGNFKRVKDYLATLPQPTDDLQSELGIDLMDRMYNDPQIAASCETLILQTLSKGPRPKPRFSDRSHELYKPSVEMYDFISYCMDSCYEDMMAYMEVGMTETLEDMLRSRLKYGHSAAEMLCRVQNIGPLANKMVLSALKPKSPHVYGFVVDAYNNVPGLAVYTGEDGPAGVGSKPLPSTPLFSSALAGKLEVPPDQLPNGWEAVPISKFAVMTHRPKFRDPRGQSALRQAYNAWYLSMQLWPEYLKFLSQFASPSLVGILAEKAREQRDRVTGDVKSPLDILYEELENFANGSVIVAEYGTAIEALFSQGDGGAFVQAINTLNHEKVKSLLLSLLATETAPHQTRAAASTHKDIMDLPTRGLKNGCCSMLHRHVFKRLIYWNYGPLAAEMLTPWATLGDMAPEDRNDSIKTWASAGFKLTPSQFSAVCNELEIEPPSAEEVDAMGDAFKLDPLAAPKAGVGAGGNSSTSGGTAPSKDGTTQGRDRDGDGVYEGKKNPRKANNDNKVGSGKGSK